MDRKSAEAAEARKLREWVEELTEELRPLIGDLDLRLLCEHVMRDRTYKDLAAETGLSIAAIRNRVSRSLAELRRLAVESLS